MGIFDKAKQKAEELAGQHSDKVEEHSDRGLDMAADRANQATGGKYADHVDTARDAADDRIGETGAAQHAADENPMVDDPDRVDPQR